MVRGVSNKVSAFKLVKGVRYNSIMKVWKNGTITRWLTTKKDTNNIVEYESLTNGLKMAIEWRIKKLHIYGDSQLIINQVNDNYLTKNEKLVPYKQMVDSLRCYFTFVLFQQIPRVENKETDAMATLLL